MPRENGGEKQQMTPAWIRLLQSGLACLNGCTQAFAPLSEKLP